MILENKFRQSQESIVLKDREWVARMLVQFQVGNFRSIREIITFSFLAAKIKSQNSNLDTENTVVHSSGLKLLKSAAIYGANASGKSNVLSAFRMMRRIILTQQQKDQRIDVEPFRLSDNFANEPTFFETIFFVDNIRYRYGFEASVSEVISEWLYQIPESKKQESMLFSREKGEFKGSNLFKEGRLIKKENKTLKNALFLTTCANFNGKISGLIFDWFGKSFVFSGLNDKSYLDSTLKAIQEEKMRREVLSLTNKLDLSIDDIQSEAREGPEGSIWQAIPIDFSKIFQPEFLGRTSHKKYDFQDNFKNYEEFDLEENESSGTQKLIAFAYPLLMAIKHGNLVLIDELDAKLHPLITCEIIKLFNSLENNKGSQLIFSTHDTNLLSKDIFRRDQIWFTEKNNFGATQFYSLADYKVRNDASFEKDYINGRYGAIPFINSEKLIDHE